LCHLCFIVFLLHLLHFKRVHHEKGYLKSRLRVLLGDFSSPLSCNIWIARSIVRPRGIQTFLHKHPDFFLWFLVFGLFFLKLLYKVHSACIAWLLVILFWGFGIYSFLEMTLHIAFKHYYLITLIWTSLSRFFFSSSLIVLICMFPFLCSTALLYQVISNNILGPLSWASRFQFSCVYLYFCFGFLLYYIFLQYWTLFEFSSSKHPWS